MEHPFLVEEYVFPQAQREPKASRGFDTMIPEPESAAALPPFPNLPPSEALLLTPADPQYADYLLAANLRTQLAPALRAVCKTENAVAVMADWVRSNSLSFAVRCGGHSYGGMVDEHHACRHPLRHIRAVLLVGSEHRATQTERGIIGYAHRIIFVLGTEEHGHRAE